MAKGFGPIYKSPVAGSVPFDNSTNDFLSEELQAATEEAIFDVKNVLFVNKQAYPGHFSTIKAALDSISDAGPNNPYVINVGPGVYVEDNSAGPLTLKPAVTLRSIGHSTVIIEPSDPNEVLFLVNQENCRLQGMTLRNVTGASALKIIASTTPAIVDFLTISNCLTPIYVQSDASATQAVFRNLRLISGSTTTDLMRVEALDGKDCIVRFYSAILTDDNGTAFESGINLSGVGARIDPNTVLLRSTLGIGTGIKISDGANVTLLAGMEISGFNKGIHSIPGSNPPVLRLLSITLFNTIDIHLEHPGTLGALAGILQRDKIINETNGSYILGYADPITGDFNSSGVITTRGWAPELHILTADGNTHVIDKLNPHTINVIGGTSLTTVKLPAGTDFPRPGHFYDLWNLSTVEVDVVDFGDNLLATIRPNGRTQILLRDASTTNGLWGVTYSLDSGNVFGSEVHFAEDDTETSTTSNSVYSTKVTMNTPASLPIGDYLINFQFIWRSSNADRETDVRVRHSTATLAEWSPSTGRVQNEELVSGFLRVQNISGSNTFTLEFKRGSSTGNATIYMKQARLYIWRIG